MNRVRQETARFLPGRCTRARPQPLSPFLSFALGREETPLPGPLPAQGCVSSSFQVLLCREAPMGSNGEGPTAAIKREAPFGVLAALPSGQCRLAFLRVSRRWESRKGRSPLHPGAPGTGRPLRTFLHPVPSVSGHEEIPPDSADRLNVCLSFGCFESFLLFHHWSCGEKQEEAVSRCLFKLEIHN